MANGKFYTPYIYVQISKFTVLCPLHKRDFIISVEMTRKTRKCLFFGHHTRWCSNAGVRRVLRRVQEAASCWLRHRTIDVVTSAENSQ